jgi:hypothetical protein
MRRHTNDDHDLIVWSAPRIAATMNRLSRPKHFYFRSRGSRGGARDDFLAEQHDCTTDLAAGRTGLDPGRQTNEARRRRFFLISTTPRAKASPEATRAALSEELLARAGRGDEEETMRNARTRGAFFLRGGRRDESPPARRRRSRLKTETTSPKFRVRARRAPTGPPPRREERTRVSFLPFCFSRLKFFSRMTRNERTGASAATSDTV